jgi:uncharacterized protein YaaR (DUF327 family)
MYEKELLKLIESIIVPSGYKTVHIGNTLEVSSSQFLEKKQVERLANKIVEQYHQPNLAEMPSELEKLAKYIVENYNVYDGKTYKDYVKDYLTESNQETKN